VPVAGRQQSRAWLVGALLTAAMTIASEAKAYEIVIEDVGFHLTVQGDGEPGCVVAPERATVEKECSGIDLAALRGPQVNPGLTQIALHALAVEGGVVLTRVVWKPFETKTKYARREDLTAIADVAATASVPAGLARPVASVVRFADVDMVETRIWMADPAGARATGRSYTVPAQGGMVLIAFVATDARASSAMEAFADKSMATLRVAPVPSAAEEVEQTSPQSNRVGRMLTVALICAVLAAAVVYVLRLRRS
jgi:hypothetical protein